MKASMYEGNHSFGLHDYEPKAPGAHEVQVDVAYCGICGSDLHVFHGDYDYRFSTLPRPIGHECSGVVAAVGAEVTAWKTGDRVAVCPLDYCGSCVACDSGNHNCCAGLNFMGLDSAGAMCNRWTVHERTLHRLPESISLTHGALVEPMAVCFHALDRSRSKAGDYAVVIGAGPIGLMTALTARYLGLRVVLSELNAVRVQRARELGFTVVDPRETKLKDFVLKSTGGVGADAVFEVSGTQSGLNTAVELIHPHSRVVLVAAYPHPMQIQLQKLFMREVDLTMTRNYNDKDFDDAIDMMAKAPIDFDALITKILPLGKVQEGMELCGSPSGEVVKVLVDCQTRE